MINHGKKNVLGVLVNAVDYEAAVDNIIKSAIRGIPYSVSPLAVHGLMTGVMDEEHRYRLNQLDLIVPDGQPVRWALNALYKTNLKSRVYGPELMLRVCGRAADLGLSIFLFGSRADVLENLSSNLEKMYPKLQIAGMASSKFRKVSQIEQELLIAEIRDSDAAIAFIGLGCPRQEIWIYENTNELSMPAIAVGAAFPFHAGSLSQAPVLLQDIGLEWLYRLSREPARLWKRYLFLNPYFIFNLLLQLTGVKDFPVETSKKPEARELYG